MKGVALYCGLVLAAVALFLLAPGLDLATSRWFYEPQQGFVLAAWPPVRLVEIAIPWIARAIFMLAIVAALWLVVAGRPLWRLDRKAIVFVVASVALGPGLLTNVVLKDHWGRARPVQLESFGGSKQFTAAPLPAAQCARNCSFISGHAALGFALVGFAFLLPPGRGRNRAQAAALGFGALVGLGRIAAGAHFLSDIVYAGLLVYGTSWALHRWIVEQDVLAAPAMLRLYRGLGDAAAGGWRHGVRLYAAPAGRIGLWALALAVTEALLIVFADRLIAVFFHSSAADLHSPFEAVGGLGLAYPYFVLFGLAYVLLRWGGRLPRLHRIDEPMRRAAAAPAFVFVSLAASGLIVDLLKIICGRTRPKLLFAAGTYDFTWLGLRADHWSFPSGHAATVAALMTALWCLWPRHLLLYILIGTVVAASRVVTGAHYPSDVVIGAVIAVVTTRRLAGFFASGRFDFGALRLQRRSAAVREP